MALFCARYSPFSKYFGPFPCSGDPKCPAPPCKGQLLVFSTSRRGMYSSYWTGFLSNQFRKVKVDFPLPYFISANQVQDSFLWKTDLYPISQWHDWIYTSCRSCRFLLARFYEWKPFFTLWKGVLPLCMGLCYISECFQDSGQTGDRSWYLLLVSLTPLPTELICQMDFRMLKSLTRPGIDPGTPHTLSHRPSHLAMESSGFRWQFFNVQYPIQSF